MSQTKDSKRSFTIQVHPVIETVVLENLEENTTSLQIMDMYASITAEKYQFDKKKLFESLLRVVPFTPIQSDSVYHTHKPWEIADMFLSSSQRCSLIRSWQGHPSLQHAQRCV